MADWVVAEAAWVVAWAAELVAATAAVAREVAEAPVDRRIGKRTPPWKRWAPSVAKAAVAVVGLTVADWA